MKEELLIDSFRNPKIVKEIFKQIYKEASSLQNPLNIMEVCGGHTHTIMKYGFLDLLPKNVNFIHGPGCPVCIMPKDRIDCAYGLIKNKEDILLITLGDMIKVPGTFGSLQKARAEGLLVDFVYSPLETLKIAQENPNKQVVFFAIGFETTTPMSAALLQKAMQLKLNNLSLFSNHVLVPPPLEAILFDSKCAINAILAPSHVSVITGAKIYEPLVSKFSLPIVVGGFEPVDVAKSILMLILQAKAMQKGESPKLEIQYSRSVTYEGNTHAQKLVETFFEVAPSFNWRGLGAIPHSSLKLRKTFEHLDAEVLFADYLPNTQAKEHKHCLCGEILKGKNKPLDCKLFANVCNPQNPLGSCMVSSEGACAAYFKYYHKHPLRKIS